MNGSIHPARGKPRSKLVGEFIRNKREAVGLSQKSLGKAFSPPVTTQFISNLERGVTPLPLNHLPTLTRALRITEAEILGVLEQEYSLKLDDQLHDRHGEQPFSAARPRLGMLRVQSEDLEMMRKLYEAFRRVEGSARRELVQSFKKVLGLETTE